MSNEDFDRVVALLTAPELVALLDQDGPVCEGPMIFSEHMELDLDGYKYENVTTICENEPVVAARDALEELQARYIDDASAVRRPAIPGQGSSRGLLRQTTPRPAAGMAKGEVLTVASWRSTPGRSIRL